MANKVHITVQKGENKKRKDSEGNVIVETYHTVKLNLDKGKAYINASTPRLPILDGLFEDWKANRARIVKALEATAKLDAASGKKETKATGANVIATF